MKSIYLLFCLSVLYCYSNVNSFFVFPQRSIISKFKIKSHSSLPEHEEKQLVNMEDDKEKQLEMEMAKQIYDYLRGDDLLVINIL